MLRESWQDTFDLDKCTHLTEGQNKYFILKPGYQIVLADESDQVVITVTDKTMMINGIKTRVIEETEFEDGKLKEISRNFFTICKEHKDVFYHGEDVDDYKDGKIVNHNGAWRAGVHGARAGLMMPGKAKVGMKHYQEVAPTVAMDRAEILANDVDLEAPNKKYKKCLKVLETSPLELEAESVKLYAPKIGMVFDDGLVIVDSGHGRTVPKEPIKVKVDVSAAYSEVKLLIAEMPKPVADAVAKLRRMGVIEGRRTMRARPLPESLALIDAR